MKNYKYVDETGTYECFYFTLSLNVSLALCCDFTVDSEITSVVKRCETWGQANFKPKSHQSLTLDL